MTSAKAVIITGGAKRVGAALALYFAKQGYDIALHYHHSQADAERVRAEIEANGRQCMLFPRDLSDMAGIPALLERIHKAMPHCTALINNASVFERAPFMETDEALFDRQMDINVKAPFFLTQAFARTFQTGCVINLLDTQITDTQGSHFAYLLSKKTFAEFTQMAARALGPAIRVNGVCPGFLLPSNGFDEAYGEKLAASLPLGAVASLEQVAMAAHSLCENPAVTGQLLFTDGGQHLL